MHHHQQDNNYPKAILFSSMVMGLFLLICYLIVLHEPFKQEDIGTGGIVVNYGTSEMGLGDDNMSVEELSLHPNANHSLPDKITQSENPIEHQSAEKNDINSATQNNEDAPSISKKNNTPPTILNVEKTAISNKPIVNPNALYKGATNNGQTLGDGTGSTPGNQGNRNGDPLSTNYGQGGSGLGNVNLSLVNRRFVNAPQIDDQGQSAGKVAVEIRVDKVGIVIFARAGAKGTTLSDLQIWKKCETAVLGARLNQLESAPEVQMGTVIFIFKVK